MLLLYRKILNFLFSRTKKMQDEENLESVTKSYVPKEDM